MGRNADVGIHSSTPHPRARDSVLALFAGLIALGEVVGKDNSSLGLVGQGAELVHQVRNIAGTVFVQVTIHTVNRVQHDRRVLLGLDALVDGRQDHVVRGRMFTQVPYVGSSRSRVGEFGERRAVSGPLTGGNEGLSSP